MTVGTGIGARSRVTPEGTISRIGEQAQLGIGNVLRDIAGVKDKELSRLHRQIRSIPVSSNSHRVNDQVIVIVRRVVCLRVEIIPVAFSDLRNRTTGCYMADIGDQQIRHLCIDRQRWRREVEQGSVRIMRIGPEKHFMRQKRATGFRGWYVAFDETRMDRIAQVKELEVEGENGIRTLRAGVQNGATAKIHHDEQFLLRPDAQLTRGNTNVPLKRRPDLTHNVGMSWIGRAHNEHTWMRMRTGITRATRIATATGI